MRKPVSPFPGFERLTTTYADLGMIDEAMHPLLKLAVYMKEAPGGGTPEIRSISHNGLISKTFETDPSAEGWQIQSGSWSNGVITSTGTVLSNVYRMQSGFSALGHLECSFLERSTGVHGGRWSDMGTNRC